MTEKYQFKIANFADAENITSLVNFVYRGETGARGWTGESHLLTGQRVDVERIREILSSKENIIILAYQNEQTAYKSFVGCVHLRKAPDHAYLGMLTVHVDLQQAGLGSAILNECERYAREVFKSPKIRMTVISLRTELIDWYRRKGYELTNEKLPFPYHDQRFGTPLREDLEFVVLEKHLL